MSKIVCAVTNDLSYDQRMIRICTSLQKAGYEVTLVGREKKSSKPLSPQIFAQKRLKLLFEKGKLFYVEYNFRLFFYLLLKKSDIINSVDLDTLSACFLAAKLKRRLLVFDAHEYFTELPEVVDRPFTRSVWKFVADWLIPKSAAAYTVNQSLAGIFSENYGLNFHIIRNVPVFKNQPVSRANFGSKILLYQGVLNEGRGLEEMIEAMKYLPDFQLWLAGEGDLSAFLRAMTQRLNLENQVKFLGHIAPDALHKITGQAFLGLNLLKNKGLNYYLSLANKAFDYVQAGVPSLQMDFPEYKILNTEKEVFLLLKNLEPQEIAREILNLSADAERYFRLQKNCEAAATLWCWEKEEGKLVHIYQTL